MSEIGHFIGQWLIDENGGLADQESQARAIVAQIRLWQADGELPEKVESFVDLHNAFDANVGWGDVIDGLEHDQWQALTERVDEILAEQNAHRER